MTSEKHAEKQDSTQNKVAPDWEAAIKSAMRSEPEFIFTAAKNVVFTHQLQQK